MKPKYSISFEQVYLICIVLWSFLGSISGYTTISASFGLPLSQKYTEVWSVIKKVLLFKILFGNLDIHEFPVKRLLKVAAILLVEELSTYYAPSNFLTPLFWFLAAGEGVDVRKVVRALYITQTVMIIMVVCLAVSGEITNLTVKRAGSEELRYALGFVHPNTFALYALQVCLMHFYLRKQRVGLLDFAYFGVVFYVIYFVANSRTNAVLMLSLMLFCFAYRLAVNGRRSTERFAGFWLKCLSFSLIGVTGLSMIETFVPITIFSDSNLQARANHALAYQEYYGLSLFGQPLILGYQNERVEHNLFTLDNSYAYLLIGFGIVVFALFMLMQILMLRKALKERDYCTLIVLAIYWVVGFTETALIQTWFNFSSFFMLRLLWPSNGAETQDAVESMIINPEEVTI